MKKIINNLKHNLTNDIISTINTNAYVDRLFSTVKDLLMSSFMNKNTIILKNRNCGGSTALVFRGLMEILFNLMKGDDCKMINIAVFDHDSANSNSKNYMFFSMLRLLFGESIRYDVRNRNCLMSKEYGFAIYFVSSSIQIDIPHYLDLALFDEFFLIEDYDEFMINKKQSNVITKNTKLFMVQTVEGVKHIKNAFNDESVNVKILTK